MGNEFAASRIGKPVAVPPPSRRPLALASSPARNIEQNVLARLGVRVDRIAHARAASRRNGTTIFQELVAYALADPHAIRDALVAELGVPALRIIEPTRLALRDREGFAALRHGSQAGAHYRDAGGGSVFLVCAETLDPQILARAIERTPDIALKLRLVTVADLRAALMLEMRERLTEHARDHLFLTCPSFSARYVANAWQGLALGVLAVALPLWFWLDWQTANLAFHISLSALFLSCVVLRLVAMLSAKPLRMPRLERRRGEKLPVYTVLVALYREAPVVPQLLQALGQLEWPRSRLEIKLVCEADDHETLAAIKKEKPPAHVEVIAVPPGTPRTKPKALAYALPTASGSFIALYDAEDRPHPEQLLEAWTRFRDDKTGRLACLQAPLVVTNDRAGPMARLFAFEYAGLFRGLLPWLARRELLVPLGGTSNHIRRDALDAVGGWDPYNVTEDADLGARLTREGYRVATITRPTFEDGPETLRVWLPQRTRWFKGWMQSWLVHMRHPVRLLRELGPGSFLVLQILFLGMVASALAHPIFLATLFWTGIKLATTGGVQGYHATLMGIDLFNVVAGYIAFLLIGLRTLSQRESAGFGKVLVFTPVYWVLLSFAAWRAVWQLIRRPHHWEKTPHQPTHAPLVPKTPQALLDELRGPVSASPASDRWQ